MKKTKKVLFISEFTPPNINGVAIMIFNLFSYFPLDSVCMLTDDPSKRKEIKDERLRLPFKHFVARVPNFSFSFIPSIRFRIILQYFWIPVIIFRGIIIVIKEKIQGIFSVNSKGPYLIAAYYLHRILKKRLYIYMFDLWSKNLENPFQSKLAQVYEKRILKSADKVFVMSEKLADYYKNKYSVDSVVINHSYIKGYQGEPCSTLGTSEEKNYFDITFTGVVTSDTSWLQLIRTVMVDLLEEKVRLKLCVPVIEYIKDVKEQNIIVKSLSRDEVLVEQKRSDVLFLPMFLRANCAKEVLETASPSKLGEYLISGVPILVFAPHDSYISEYAKKGQWALIVNEFDKEQLKKAILRLKNDNNLRKALVANALKAAVDHDARIESEKIQKHIFKI